MVGASLVAERRPATPDVEPLVDFVHEVIRSSLRRVHPTIAEEGITMGQFWALHTVSTLESASLSTVARYLGLTAPTVCANVDQLEAAGLVRRHRSERDRRAVELSLTPRGRKVESRVWREIAEMMADAARGLPKEDLAAAVRTFRAIARGLEDGASPLPEVA